MSDRTPGRWQVDDSLLPDGTAAGGFDIMAPTPSGEPQWVGSAYTRADARLMAAAPVLLSAVISAHDLLTDPDADERNADMALDQLRYALFLAMGWKQ